MAYKDRLRSAQSLWHYDTPLTDPPPSKTPLVDTPVRQRNTAKPVFQINNASTKKATVYEEICPILKEVDIDMFFDNILPRLPESVDLDDVIAKLKKDKAIFRGRLARFPKKPSKMDGVENKVFENLELMVDDIVKAVKTTKPTMRFMCNPDGVPISEHRDSLSRPDGYVLVLDPSGEIKWVAIAIPAEYKKYLDAAKQKDNDFKTIWSVYHSMREDARKRFVVSFTIEDNIMRLWFCNRELFVVSKPINFIRDFRRTVHLFLSVMFAAPYQLGWDPTMIRLADGEFDILVRDEKGKERWYRTEGLLSDVGAESLFGRGTRVWRARLLTKRKGVPTGSLVVLKDSWIDKDRPREGAIYRELRDYNDAKEYLLEVECFGDVYIKAAKDFDHTRMLAFKRSSMPRFGRVANSRFVKTVQDVAIKVKGLVLKARLPEALETSTSSRMHTRLVLKGVYTPLSNLSLLEDIFRALADTALAVQSFHKRGWVHRDLTPANILTYRSGAKPMVKLADIEYAKSVDSKTSHTIRSGFCEFRAVEASMHLYKFTKTEVVTTRRKPGGRLPVPVFTKPSSHTAAGSTSTTAAPSFRFNPLHDLEAVWWISIYVIVDKEVRNGNEVYSVSQDQRNWSNKLFYDANSEMARWNVFTDAKIFKQMVESLHPSLQHIGTSLGSLRATILAAHKMAELPENIFTVDLDLAQELADSTNTLLTEIADSLKDHQMTVQCIPEYTPKRKEPSDSTPATSRPTKRRNVRRG